MWAADASICVGALCHHDPFGIRTSVETTQNAGTAAIALNRQLCAKAPCPDALWLMLANSCLRHRLKGETLKATDSLHAAAFVHRTPETLSAQT